MIDTAKQLKNMGAKRVFICTTFGLFTDGMSKFDDGYEKGYFDAVITTNLTMKRLEGRSPETHNHYRSSIKFLYKRVLKIAVNQRGRK